MSHTADKKMFYKLINEQRNHKQSSISELIIDDVHVTELDMIRKGWASYFEKLATPVDDQNFDNNYKSKVQLRKLLIQNACEYDNTDFEPISREQIIKTIKNNEKQQSCRHVWVNGGTYKVWQ